MTGRARHPYLDASDPIAFAHRGHADGVAENSAEAIDAAVSAGYGYVETDVQATRDGVAVLFHDDTTERLLGEPGRIADRDWTDLSTRRLVGGGRIVRLDEVLSDHPRLRLNIDAKTDDVVRPMGDAIKGALDRVCAASFDTRRTRALRQRLGSRLCWSPAMAEIARIWAGGWGVPVGGRGAPCLQVPPTWRSIPIVTPRFIKAAHDRGAAIHVWTVNDPLEMHALLDLGVDGLMTDDAPALKEVMTSRGFWSGFLH
ncbi:glycerophosphodiester phosphodiesterase family protein [Palleronia sp.]|uniref:glycerophosphodiester phosphodiesterase family protein n=1 Tax=Palleronia sp. TaxID=1940284 RepID=UPI0035C7C0C9